jgi:hypothetical protein
MKRSEALEDIVWDMLKLPNYADMYDYYEIADAILKHLEEKGMAPPYNQPAQYDGWLEACVAPVGARREWEPEDV